MPRKATAKQTEAVTALATVAREVALQQAVEVLEYRFSVARRELRSFDTVRRPWADAVRREWLTQLGRYAEAGAALRVIRRLLRRGKR